MCYNESIDFFLQGYRDVSIIQTKKAKKRYIF